MRKTVLVTGATSGIGEACAKAFANAGYDVIITARRADKLLRLKEELERHGAAIEKDGDLLRVSGRLEAGAFSIAGNVSSQYISGLLFAMCALKAPCSLDVTGEVQSRSYIEMTLAAMKRCGIVPARAGDSFALTGKERIRGISGDIEGDWSNAAFWLCAGAI